MLVRAVIVVMLVTVLFPVNFAREFLLAMDQDIDFGSRNPAAIHPRNFQPGTDIEGCHRALEYLRGHTGIEQRAEKHVAANAGKTI